MSTLGAYPRDGEDFCSRLLLMRTSARGECLPLRGWLSWVSRLNERCRIVLPNHAVRSEHDLPHLSSGRIRE